MTLWFRKQKYESRGSNNDEYGAHPKSEARPHNEDRPK